MNILLEKMVRMYGKPNSPDPDFVLEELGRSTNQFSDDVLFHAWEKVKIAPKKSKFPSPDLVVASCQAAALELDRDLRRQRTNLKTKVEGGAALADKLIVCEMGRKAASGGWINQLHSFIARNGRLPKTPREEAELITKAHEFDEAYIRLGRELSEAVNDTEAQQKPVGSWQRAGGASRIKLMRSCLRGAEFFLKERDRLAAMADGGKAA